MDPTPCVPHCPSPCSSLKEGQQHKGQAWSSGLKAHEVGSELGDLPPSQGLRRLNSPLHLHLSRVGAPALPSGRKRVQPQGTHNHP